MANTDTRLFRVATKLFSDLFLNGTHRNKAVSQDIMRYQRFMLLARRLRCATQLRVDVRHQDREET
jgi:hypothetical protein